jgi:molybdate transport system substrate-binding protein
MTYDQDSIRLLSGLAVQASFNNGISSTINELGIDVDIEWNPTKVIEERIKQGVAADVLIVTDESLHAFIAAGTVSADHCFPLINSFIGLAVKKGAPLPEISSVESCLAALLNARSVAYSLTGASGIYMQQLWNRFGQLEKINARATAIDKGLAAEKLLSGEADIAVQQISELIVVPGVEVVGPLPDEIQKVSAFSVGILASAANKPAAHKLVSFLTSREAADIFERNGLKARNG